jgi:hypothetical protein
MSGGGGGGGGAFFASGAQMALFWKKQRTLKDCFTASIASTAKKLAEAEAKADRVEAARAVAVAAAAEAEAERIEQARALAASLFRFITTQQGLLCIIVSFVDAPKDLARLERVSKCWRLVGASNPELWKAAALARSPLIAMIKDRPSSTPCPSWKAALQRWVLAERSSESRDVHTFASVDLANYMVGVELVDTSGSVPRTLGSFLENMNTAAGGEEGRTLIETSLQLGAGTAAGDISVICAQYALDANASFVSNGTTIGDVIGIPLGDLKLRSLVILRKFDAKIFVLASKFELEENFVEFAADENQDPTIFCDHRCQGPWSSCEGHSQFPVSKLDCSMAANCSWNTIILTQYDNPVVLTDVSINVQLEKEGGKIHRVDPNLQVDPDV